MKYKPNDEEPMATQFFLFLLYKWHLTLYEVWMRSRRDDVHDTRFLTRRDKFVLNSVIKDLN